MDEKSSALTNGLTTPQDLPNNVGESQTEGGQNPQTTSAPIAPGDTVPDWVRNDPAAAYRELQKLRQENADKRIRLQQIEQQVQAERDKALAEQGDYKTLYESLQAKVEPLEETAQQLEATLAQMVKARRQNVPEYLHELLDGLDPVQQLAWLDANADKLTPQSAPATDAGAQGDRVKQQQLSPELSNMAKKMGITPERLQQRLEGRS